MTDPTIRRLVERERRTGRQRQLAFWPTAVLLGLFTWWQWGDASGTHWITLGLSIFFVVLALMHLSIDVRRERELKRLGYDDV